MINRLTIPVSNTRDVQVVLGANRVDVKGSGAMRSRGSITSLYRIQGTFEPQSMESERSQDAVAKEAEESDCRSQMATR